MSEQQDFILPSDPVARKKIKDSLHEICGALQFIEDKRAYIKDITESIQEEYQIPKKISAKVARVLYKNNYGDVSAETDLFSTMFEVLFQGSAAPVVDNDQEE